MAKQVKVYFLCDGSTEIYSSGRCYRGGRFDLTVEKGSFALLNHGATYSLESAWDATWTDPSLFGPGLVQSSASKNGNVPMWIEVDFPFSETFLVKNLAFQKRGDGLYLD